MSNQERWYGTGRRKQSTARVWLMAGEGKVTINRRSMDRYFGREVLKMILQQPLELVNQQGKVDILVYARGGGLSGQAGAIRHGIARALLEMDPELRGPLEKAGFLTRDAPNVDRNK